MPQAAGNPQRQRMIPDLINRVLPGLGREEVVELLGEPWHVVRTENEGAVELCYYAGSVGLSGTSWLIVYVSRDGRVTSARAMSG